MAEWIGISVRYKSLMIPGWPVYHSGGFLLTIPAIRSFSRVSAISVINPSPSSTGFYVVTVFR